jgi:membrane-bound metal-dependent hydrolase YbcI (DUF457 family)
MLGHTHALSGAVTGAAVGELLAHLPVPGTLALAGLTAGFATFNDLDQCGSCAARSLGFISEMAARIIRKLSGGHRHLTHSLLGVAIFTAAAWAACAFRGDTAGRVALAALLTLGIAAGLGALRIGGHLADLGAIAIATGMAIYGWDLALVPLACGLGMTTHIAGDMLTKEGCPVLDPLTRDHFKWWPRPLAFTTGTKPEALVALALLAALGWLAWHAVLPILQGASL